MKDLLEEYLPIIIFLSFILGPYLIVKTSIIISKFRETRKYKAKLKQIAPQIESINIEELSAKLLSTKEAYLELMNQIQQRYGAAEEVWKDARTYKDEETVYKTLIEDWYSVKLR